MKRVWTTKNGEKIKIRDMETSHIKNCLNILNKYHSRVIVKRDSMSRMFSKYQDEIDEETDNMLLEGFDDDAQEYINSFEKELERRGI